MLTNRKPPFGFILLFALFCFSGFACQSAQPPQRVLLITIDTLRPDHLSCYGYNRKTSPNIDKIASEGVRYDGFFCQVTSTTPSHASILTGLPPRSHGVLANWEPLLPEFRTIAEILKDSGFRTSAVISNWSLKRERGLNQGFDFYDDFLPEQEMNRPNFFQKSPEQATRSGLEWLAKNKEGRFFLWINYMDPHGPYTPPAPYNASFGTSGKELNTVRLPFSQENDAPHSIPAYQRLANADKPGYYISQYDGEIQNTDYWLGKLIDKISEWNLLDTTLIIITSDHGESLGEHDYYFMHSNLTYREQAAIPLIIRYPRLFPRDRVVHTRTQTVDLLPTILEACEISYAGEMEGKSLLSLESETPSRPVIVLSEGAKMTSVYEGPWELVLRERKPVELFNLESDPWEANNLLEHADPEITERLLSLAGTYLDRPQPNKAYNLTDKEKEVFRSLGYIN